MALHKEQLNILSGYFSDVSKIVVGSAVVGFFIPSGTGIISIPIFLGGIIAAAVFLFLSLQLTQ